MRSSYILCSVPPLSLLTYPIHTYFHLLRTLLGLAMAEEKTTGTSSGVDIEKEKHVDPTLKKHAQDADEAMKAFDEMQGEAIELDEGTNKRLLRIIDWHMMPIMCFVYGMNYLDSMFVP